MIVKYKKMCSWSYCVRHVSSSYQSTSLGFNSGDGHLFSYSKITPHIISCRVVKRQKRTVFDTHVLHAILCYTKFNNAFVLLFVHECLRDTQTFWCLCTKILILHHTHTQYLYTHFIQTFHTHKYKTQNVFEKIASTFCHSRVLSGARDTKHTKAISG